MGRWTKPLAIAIVGTAALLPMRADSQPSDWQGPGWYLINSDVIPWVEGGPYASGDQCEAYKAAHPDSAASSTCEYFGSEADMSKRLNQ